MARPDRAWLQVVGAGAVVVLLAIIALASGGRATAAPSLPSEAAIREAMFAQGLSAHKLLGNDAIDLATGDGRVVAGRIQTAWETARRAYLGAGRSQGQRELAMREGWFPTRYERELRTRLDLVGRERPTPLDRAAVKLRIALDARWAGETEVHARRRLLAVRLADKARWVEGDRFQRELDRVRASEGRDVSQSVRDVCDAISFGPEMLGAIGGAVGIPGANRPADALRARCRQVGNVAEDPAGAVGDVAAGALGALGHGLFGDLLEEVVKGVSWVTRQVARAMHETTQVRLDSGWLRRAVSRTMAAGMLVAVIAGILGIAHAALRLDPMLLGRAVAGAALAGVAAGMVMTLVQLAIALVDLLLAISIGTDPDGSARVIERFADQSTEAMQEARMPAIVALLLSVVLLLAALVVWLELVMRQALIYALVFFYPLVVSAAPYKPAAELLSAVHRLLAAAILAKLVSLGTLHLGVQMLAASDGGGLDNVLGGLAMFVLAAVLPLMLAGMLSTGWEYGSAKGATMGAALAAGRLGGKASRPLARGAAAHGKALLTDRRQRSSPAGGGDGPHGEPPGGDGPGGGRGGGPPRRDGGLGARSSNRPSSPGGAGSGRPSTRGSRPSGSRAGQPAGAGRGSRDAAVPPGRGAAARTRRGRPPSGSDGQPIRPSATGRASAARPGPAGAAPERPADSSARVAGAAATGGTGAPATRPAAPMQAAAARRGGVVHRPRPRPQSGGPAAARPAGGGQVPRGFDPHDRGGL